MRNALIVTLLLVMAQLVVAGGIVTNTNQSAQFIRTLSRNASTEIDATYFNPAGLTQLWNGWHFAVYNQTIFQEKTVTNNFEYLNQDEFIGEVNVPFFPNFYAAFKKDKLAVAFGFGPNGGGGTADFANGLPSLEIPVSLARLTPGVTGYKTDISLSGSSVYYGFQLDAAYALNEMISISLGGRYISAVNSYEGSIKNIQVGVGDIYVPAGVPDKSVDAKQTATGLTPIIGVNVRPIENLNVGVKYELNTGLKFTNDTEVDDFNKFPDGAETNADIPAILALGAEYAFLPQFRGSLSFNTYFDKSADWDGREELIDSNTWELALGLEYDITEALLVSAGFLNSNMGMSEAYQTDLDHDLSSNTVGLGLRYTVAKVWDIDLGGLYTMYTESEKSGSQDMGQVSIPYVETYNRSNVAFAIGLGYHF